MHTSCRPGAADDEQMHTSSHPGAEHIKIHTFCHPGIEQYVKMHTSCHPGTALFGSTKIATGAVIGPRTTLSDCVVKEGASVLESIATQTIIGEGATVGPFTYLRAGTQLGDASKAGAFVEMKNATVGTGSKVPHLSQRGGMWNNG